MLYIIIAGSNLSNKDFFIEQAFYHLSNSPNITVIKKTEVVDTLPVIELNQPNFLNQGFLIDTILEPVSMLELVKSIEVIVSTNNINKPYRYGPRAIDLDIVWMSSTFSSLHLTIPHIYNRCRSWVRNFIATLVPEAIDTISNIEYKKMAVHSIKTPFDFILKKEKNEKITVLTCYDYITANLLERTSIDTILVGDSLGNIIQGENTTTGVTIDDIVYHTKAVRRGFRTGFIIADMPFLSYKISKEQALLNAAKLIQKGKANAVKVEGAGVYLPIIKSIIDAGIPVMGHLGLEPQQVLVGGLKLQGKTEQDQNKILEDAKALQEIGCFAIVLEMVPADFAKKVSETLTIPVIGIGAGAYCDGQVLVLHDMLGMNPDFKPKFLRHYASFADQTISAVEHYCKDVREQSYPQKNESY